MDLEEATVEAWVLFEFDPAQREEGVWRGMGVGFTLDVPKSDMDLGAGMSISVGLKNAGRHGEVKSGCFLRVGFHIDGKEVPHPVLPECTKFGQNQWHHVAATWREGRFLRVYFDGKQVAERDFPSSIVRDIPANGRVVVGHTGYVRENALVIDEVRLSSIARRPEDLGCHAVPLKPDPFTLLLENFERVREKDGQRTTTPTVLATVNSPASFELTGGRIVPGKAGNALAFDPKTPK